MLSEYFTSPADVSFHIVGLHLLAVSVFGKNPMQFAIFGVFLCGFAVFGPPLHKLGKFIECKTKILFRIA